MEFHRKAAEIYEEYSFSGGSKNAAPTAVFLDDAVFNRFSPIEGYAGMFYELCKTISFTGTPYQLFLLEDLADVDPAEYRLAFFCPTAETSWTPETLAALDKWKSGGRMLVFTDAFNTNPQKASGIVPGEAGFVREPGDALVRADAAGRTTSLLRRHPVENYSVYCTSERIPSADSLRRLILAAAGQVYVFGGDIAYASERYIAVHAASDGVKRICIPYKAELVNVFTGEVLPGNESFAEAVMVKGETLLLEVRRYL